jgi:hypothetical protein
MSPRTPFTVTQATYNRRILQEQAERHGRMLGHILAIEIIGFAFIIALELIRL